MAAGFLALAPTVAGAFDTVTTLPWPSSGRFPAWEGEPVPPWSVFAYGGLMHDSNPFRREDGGHVNLHAIEWGTPELLPLGFHYREWEGDQGFVYQADIANAYAQVTRVDRDGQKRNERFPFPSGTQLPLLARRRLLAEGHTAPRRITLPVFDPLQRKILARDHWVGELRQSAPGVKVRVYGVEPEASRLKASS